MPFVDCSWRTAEVLQLGALLAWHGMAWHATCLAHDVSEFTISTVNDGSIFVPHVIEDL